MDKNHRRHVRVWKFLRATISIPFKSIYGFSCQKVPEIKEPFLLLANHNTNLDPALIGLNFPQQMYFVASENVYRAGFASKVLKYLFEPIAKIKGASDTQTVMKTIRTLRNGMNVCIFAEGNRSFNGKTGIIQDATGKLVKVSAASLITYKFTGGYFTNPRWGYKIRKGKMYGQIVNIYSPEQLKSMTPDEINECIRKDLWEDAYETQKSAMIAYKGKNRAVGMECALGVCPCCKKIDSIATKGNIVFCKECGVQTEYNKYGYFDENFNFQTIAQWDLWQTSFYKEIASSVTDNTQSLFFDSDVTLCAIGSEHSSTLYGTGHFEMYKDRFVFTNDDRSDSESITVMLKDIPDMSIFGKCTLLFTDSTGIHYELKPASKKVLINARKYLSLWEILK